VDMIKAVKHEIERNRQLFREEMPKLLKENFTRDPSKEQRTAMFMMAKADVMALVGREGVLGISTTQDVMKLLSDTHESLDVDGAVRALEDAIGNIDSAHKNLLLRKSRELAGYMVNGTRYKNMLTNAWAITMLPAEGNFMLNQRPQARDNHLVRNVDQLVSLYAWQLMAPAAKREVVNLLRTEQEGMGQIMDHLADHRRDEQDRIVNSSSNIDIRMNHYKGYMTAERNDNSTLVVESRDNHVQMRLKGFTRIGAYERQAGDPAYDELDSDLSYYYAAHNVNRSFKQGLVQNIHRTAGGLDLDLGRTYGLQEETIGAPIRLYRGDEDARDLADETVRDWRSASFTSEDLQPILNSDGVVVGFERMLNPEHTGLIEKNTDLLAMLGAGQGRMFEEEMAQGINEQLLFNMADMLKEDMVRGVSGPMNVAKDIKEVLKKYTIVYRDNLDAIKDPVVKASLSLWPEYFWDAGEAAFRDVVARIPGLNEEQDKGIPILIRNDQINDVPGFHKASIGDLTTGRTRWDPALVQKSQDIFIGLFGKNAFKYLTQSERVLEAVADAAKTTTIIKYMVVPALNIISNVMFASMRGINVIEQARILPRKLADIETYVRNEQEGRRLQVELTRSNLSPQERDLKLKRLGQLEEASRRLSIWPLIERGEFGSVSDLDSQADGTPLFNKGEGGLGNLYDRMSRAWDDTPEGLKTAGRYIHRYGWIAKDTPIFRMMRKTVDYGDFVFKAMTYDHLMEKEGLTSAQALARVTEEYIHYDMSGGRGRNYVEGIGLFHFFNYKLRALKVGWDIMMQQPFRALLYNIVPTPDFLSGVGNPITDSIVGVGAQGNLMHSIGWDQLWNAIDLHPTKLGVEALIK